MSPYTLTLVVFLLRKEQPVFLFSPSSLSSSFSSAYPSIIHPSISSTDSAFFFFFGRTEIKIYLQKG